MGMTLEQAQALLAIRDHGSFSKAAEKLNKRHSALIQSIQKLEEENKIKVLDRSGYRTALTPQGNRLLTECEKVVALQTEVDLVCRELSSGWEPTLSVVIDGILPIDSLLASIRRFGTDKVPTKISIRTEFHSGVENAFQNLNADLMISVIPPVMKNLRVKNLETIAARLVAHRDHPLFKIKRPKLEDLQKHAFITVRGSHQMLQLSTTALDSSSAFHFNDFHSKKQALLAGIGYGWMPDYLIEKELKSGKLLEIRWEGASTHTYHPKIYSRGSHLGKAAALFLSDWSKA